MSDKAEKAVVRCVESVVFTIGKTRYSVEREDDGSVWVVIDDGNVSPHEVDAQSILDICAKVRYLIKGDSE